MKYRIFKDGYFWRVTLGDSDFGTWVDWDAAVQFVVWMERGPSLPMIDWRYLTWRA